MKKYLIYIIFIGFLLYRQFTFRESEIVNLEALPTNKTVTLVSAFYNLNITKYNGTQTYLEWYSNLSKFIRKDIRFIIYVDSMETMQILIRAAPDFYNVEYVILPLTLLRTFTLLSEEEWKRQHELDHEQKHQSINAYIVWLAKTEFVLRTIDERAEKSDYYMWMDLGSIRISYQQQNIFPNSYFVDKYCKNKMCFNIVDNRFLFRSTFSYSWLERSIHVAGNNFVGDVNSWRWFNEAFYSKTLKLQKNNYFIGKDQNTYALLVRKHPERFKLLCSGVYKEWFYSLYVFLGATIPQNCNKLYKLNLPVLCKEMKYC